MFRNLLIIISLVLLIILLVILVNLGKKETTEYYFTEARAAATSKVDINILKLSIDELREPLIKIESAILSYGYIPNQEVLDNYKYQIKILDKEKKVLFTKNLIIPVLSTDQFAADGSFSTGTLDKPVQELTYVLPVMNNQKYAQVIKVQGELVLYEAELGSLTARRFTNEILENAFSDNQKYAAAPVGDGFLDVVFIGDDYSDQQLPDFLSDIEKIQSYLSEEEPFSIRSDQVRYGYVENTQDLGCSNPENRFLECNWDYAQQIVQNSGTSYDKIIIIYNHKGYGGAAFIDGVICGIDNGDSIVQSAKHELSHTFGLYDEYSYGPQGELPTFTNCSVDMPNSKWNEIVPDDSYYAQCKHDIFWRSSYTSIMKDLTFRESEHYNTISINRVNQAIDYIAGPSSYSGPSPDANIVDPPDGTNISGSIQVEYKLKNSTHLHRTEVWVSGFLKIVDYWPSGIFTLQIPEYHTDITIKAYDGLGRMGQSSTIVLNPAVISPTLTPGVTQIASVTPGMTVTITATPSPVPTSGDKPLCGQADVDDNNVFNYVDFDSIAKVYNKTCTPVAVDSECGSKDVNGDGAINYIDFDSFAKRYYPFKTTCKL